MAVRETGSNYFPKQTIIEETKGCKGTGEHKSEKEKKKKINNNCG